MTFRGTLTSHSTFLLTSILAVGLSLASENAALGETPSDRLATANPAAEKRTDPYVYSIVPGPDGTLQGRIRTHSDSHGGLESAAGITVQIIRRGEIAGTATTAADGTYSMSGLAPGVYSIVAQGETALTAFSFRVIEAADDVPNGPQLETAGVSTLDLPVVRQILGPGTRRRIPHDEHSSEHFSNEDRAGYASGLSIQTVRVAEDGLLYGWVRCLEGDNRYLEGMTVHFISDNRKVAIATVDEDGRFAVDGLDSGIYSAIGLNPLGAQFAVGVEVLNPGVPGRNEFIPAGLIQTEEFAVAVVLPLNHLPEDSEDDSETVADGQPPMNAAPNPQIGSPPAGATGSPPAAPGGAPGVGGGSGLTEILTVGGGIWALIELSDDDKSPASGSN